ncbi:hypothetical protein PR048_002188 [Dryococelus australis]|uniref:Uncharacterized protein n=1 Tax=Dryococelus australis TaxID=614101 RepID=A0ABQ9IK82_9NEOP|nr:hypothetical protein PR048_002188 [Dryococelus australis]
MPEISDQAAYYKRRMFFHSFTICEEAAYDKDKNQILSALQHRHYNLYIDEVATFITFFLMAVMLKTKFKL